VTLLHFVAAMIFELIVATQALDTAVRLIQLHLSVHVRLSVCRDLLGTKQPA
jgi:hypothetical protein